jgi:hypothetical protein
MMAAEDSHQEPRATTKVCTTSRFENRPSQNQGFQRHETPKIAVFGVEFAKSGYPRFTG